MNTITKLILVTLLAIVLITFGIAAVSASDEVEIVSVTVRCNRGDVLAKMTLFNYSDQDRSPGVYLRLYQLIPDSNEPQLVDQVSFDYLILFAGEEGVVNHRFLEPDIDPKAIELWLEGGVSVAVVGESFPPCLRIPLLPSPKLASPVPTVTPTRVSEVTGTDRPSATPETVSVISLPNAGTGGDEVDSWKSLRFWAAILWVGLPTIGIFLCRARYKTTE